MIDLTRTEKSLLLYLETCLVDNLGKVQAARMNVEDFDAIAHLKELGLIDFGRLPFKDIEKSRRYLRVPNTHWVRFSDEAWKIAHALRRERTERHTPTLEG